MYDEGKALAFFNGVNAGRMEILKQIQDILDKYKGDYPEEVEAHIIELYEKYHKDGVI